MTTTKLFRTKTTEWVSDPNLIINDAIKNGNKQLEMYCFTFDPNVNKICKKCLEIKLLSEFYIYKGKYLSPCKECQKKRNNEHWKATKRKGSGFERLPPETQDQIIEAFSRGDSVKAVSKLTGVNYQSLRLWKIKGKINKS